MNLIQKAKGAIANKRALFAAAMATPMLAKFAVMITAIGTAVLSVIVLIQGFRLAAGMTKTAR